MTTLIYPYKPPICANFHHNTSTFAWYSATTSVAVNTLIVDKDNITTAAPSVTTNVLLLKIGFSNKNNTHFIGFSNKNNTYFIGFSNNTSYIQIQIN